MSSTGSSIDLKRGMVLGLLAFVLAFCWYYISIPAWSTYQTAVAFHTLLAYLSAFCSGAIIVRYDTSKEDTNTILHSVFIFLLVINIGRAIRLIFFNDFINLMGTVEILATDLFVLLQTSVLVFVSMYTRLKFQHMNRTSIVLFLAITALLLQGMYTFLILPILTQNQIGVLALILGVSSGVVMVSTGIFWYKYSSPTDVFDSTLLSIGLAIFVISWVPLGVSIFLESYYWTFSYSLQAIGLFILNLSFSVPYLRKVGMNRQRAFTFISALAAFAFIPVFVTVLVEVIIPGFVYVSRDPYIVIHFGIAVLTLVIAVLVERYNHRSFSWQRYPLLHLFVIWSAIETYLVLYTTCPFFAIRGESIMPYILGSFFTVILLTTTAIISRRTPKPELKKYSAWFLRAGFPLTISLVFFAELVQTFLESIVVGLRDSGLGVSFLIVTNLFALFGFLYIGISFIEKSKGRITIDALTVGYLAIWIVPNLLKAIYDDWTAGWWAAEILLLIGLLVFPAMIGILYLKEMDRSQAAKHKATLYADLLVHDISNYHQAISVSLGLLGSGTLTPDREKTIIEEASKELLRADSLIRNVRRLGKVDELESKGLKPIDVVKTATLAFDIVAKDPKADKFQFIINKEIGECYILANELFLDILINLIQNAVDYSKEQFVISIEIERANTRHEDLWRIHVIDQGCGIPPEKRDRLFRRYMSGSEGTGLGLSVVKALVDMFYGKIWVEDRLDGDYKKGTVFVMEFPAIIQK